MKELLQLLMEHFGAFIGAVLTGLAGFLFGKRKLQAEVAGINADNEGKEIENADKLVRLYKETLDDLGNRYEAKFKEFSEVSDKKVVMFQEQIDFQKRINEQLKAENNLLKAENTMLKAKLRDHGITL
jgi:outer membrane protein TolC